MTMLHQSWPKMRKNRPRNILRVVCSHSYPQGKQIVFAALRADGADFCRPTTNAPKPNTRFLKNIMKETDNHNAALRAKEVHDAKVRLRRLHGDRGERLNPLNSRSDVENRPSKRRRLDPKCDEDLMLRRTHTESFSQAEGEDDRRTDKSSRRYQRDYSNDEDQIVSAKYRQHRHHHHRSHRRRSRSRSEERCQRASRDRRSRHKDRSRSPRFDRDRRHKRKRRRARTISSNSSTDIAADDSTARSRFVDKKHPPQSVERRDEHHSKVLASRESDSDPLESIIGPCPPPSVPKVQARGRGTFASASAIDSHFSLSYNPADDIHPNSASENDWDQALEALRDRQRWKQQGADRLRSAGFTEEEVGKWEKGGEKREEDVRWKGRGEGREWDRGKVFKEDGVETKSEWGRLKGT